MPDSILIEKYDPFWPELFRREAVRIRTALGDRALRVEHTGSTSVPLLVAKPIIDILLVVADSTDEAAYAPGLESAGYSLRFREPDWYEHRLFRGPDTDINLHVLSAGCLEIESPGPTESNLLERRASPARPIQPDRSETTVRSIRESASMPANGRAICNMINHHRLPVAA